MTKRGSSQNKSFWWLQPAKVVHRLVASFYLLATLVLHDHTAFCLCPQVSHQTPQTERALPRSVTFINALRVQLTGFFLPSWCFWHSCFQLGLTGVNRWMWFQELPPPLRAASELCSGRVRYESHRGGRNQVSSPLNSMSNTDTARTHVRELPGQRASSSASTFSHRLMTHNSWPWF